MKTCTCYRCGKSFSEMSWVRGEKQYQLRRFLPGDGGYGNTFRCLDLCPVCQRELESWIENRSDKVEEPTYIDPMSHLAKGLW